LLSLGSAMSLAEWERFRLLTDAVEAYEELHYPIPEPSHAALIQHLVEARGITPARLAQDTRLSPKVISDTLRGRRELNGDEAAILAAYFHVERSVFEKITPTVHIFVSWADASTANESIVFDLRRTSVTKANEYARDVVTSFLPRQSPAAVASELQFQVAFA
jgi:antitoxin component HigA of HigAB toxin-antitoxin module